MLTRHRLALLIVIGLHGGFWLLLTNRMPPRLPVPRGALMVQLIATPVSPPSGGVSEWVTATATATLGAPAPAPALSPLPAQPVVDIREVLPDELPADAAGEPGYWEAQQVDQRARARAELVPVYPVAAFERRESGQVVVEILIGAQGDIDALRIVAATTGFAASALAAFDGMYFDPAIRGGQPVASRLLVALTYRLNEHIATTVYR